MGSGVLLAALVVLWFVVLVPMVVTRGDAPAGRGEEASSGRTLQRRRAVAPVTSAETERVAGAAAEPRPAPAAAEHAPVVGEQQPELPHPSVPLAPVHPLRPGRVVA